MPIQDVPLISHYLCLCILGISRFWFEFWSEIFGTKFKFPIFQYFFFFFQFWSNYLFDTTNHCVEVVNEGPHGDGNVRGKRKIKRGKTISNFEPIKTALDDYLTTLQVKQTFQWVKTITSFLILPYLIWRYYER